MKPKTPCTKISAIGDVMIRKAFTLIELLVVIAVIAVLMGILMPALNRARDMGRRAACMSNMRVVGMGLHMYT